MRRLYRFLLATALAAAVLPAAAQTLIGTVPVGIDPYQVGGNTTTNTIYVSNACGTVPDCGGTSPGTVTVVDGANNTVTATVTVGLYDTFFVVNPVTNKIYVTNYDSNSVSVIDGTTNTVTATVAVGANPVGAAINPVTNMIYILNSGNGQGTTISVIDGDTDTVVATVTVGNFPLGAAVNTVTNTVYVTNYCGNQFGCNMNPVPGTVSVIDGATNTVTNTVTVGDGPFLVLLNQVTNKIYVQNTCGNDLQCVVSGNNSQTIGTVTQIDGATLATASANTGNGSAAMAINTVANQVYVNNNADNTTTFIDGVTLATTTVNVGVAPDDVEVNPVTDKIYVCDSGNNMVTAIDGLTLATTTVGVGSGPFDAWVNPVTNRVYVSNLNDSTLSVLAGAQIATATTLTSTPNPSNYLQQVTFTATVTASNSGSPTGTVTFTADGTTICNSVPLVPVQNGSAAQCQTSSLAVGSHNILANYSGDINFAPSRGALTQVVLASGDFTVLVTPGSATVTQGYNNNNDPFFAQTINVTVQPLNGYNNTVSLSCSVSPALTGGSCIVNPPSSGLVDGNLSTTLTISAGIATPIGSYTVTVTGQDNNRLMHSAMLTLCVIGNGGSGITIPPGGGGTIMVYFPGPPGTPIGDFSCPLVSGTGLTGQQPLGVIGGNCTFTPASGTIPGPIMLTISGCQVARLHTHMPIYASLFFGLPGIVFLGPLAVGKGRRRKLLQIIGIFLVICAMLLAVGCGGYGQLTPTGHYQVLVQGTGPDGTVYSAVVPVTVTPLN